MSEIFQEFFVVYKAETKQLREALDQVRKSTEDIQKRFKNVTEENKNFQLSISGVARELLNLGAVFNSLSNVNNFSKGLQKTRQELAMTSVQTGELASDINALDSTFQYYGAPKGLLTASLPKIQDIIRTNGDLESSLSPIKSLLKLSEIISKSGSLSGARIALQGMGLPPELATALYQSSFNEKFNQRQIQYGSVNGLTEQQLLLTQKQSDLKANFEELYNAFAVPKELSIFKSILDYFNSTLPKKNAPGANTQIIDTNKIGQGQGIGLALLGGIFSSLTDSSRSFLENTRDILLVIQSMVALGGKLGKTLIPVFGFILRTIVSIGLMGGGLVGLIGILITAGGVLYEKWKPFHDLMVNIAAKIDAMTARVNNVQDVFKKEGFSGVGKLLFDLPDNFNKTVLPPSSLGGTANNNNVSVQVKGITINTLPGQNPEEIKNVIDNYFKKHVGNTLFNYITPVVI